MQVGRLRTAIICLIVHRFLGVRPAVMGSPIEGCSPDGNHRRQGVSACCEAFKYRGGILQGAPFGKDTCGMHLRNMCNLFCRDGKRQWHQDVLHPELDDYASAYEITAHRKHPPRQTVIRSRCVIWSMRRHIWWRFIHLTNKQRAFPSPYLQCSSSSACHQTGRRTRAMRTTGGPSR